MPQKLDVRLRILFKMTIPHQDEIDSAFKAGQDAYYSGAENPYNECDNPRLYAEWELEYDNSQKNNEDLNDEE